MEKRESDRKIEVREKIFSQGDGNKRGRGGDRRLQRVGEKEQIETEKREMRKNKRVITNDTRKLRTKEYHSI